MMRPVNTLVRLSPVSTVWTHRVGLVYELTVGNLSTFKFHHHRYALLIDVLEHVDKWVAQVI